MHYVTPTEDNQRQAEGMKERGLFGAVVQTRSAQIIVADVDRDARRDSSRADGEQLGELIRKPIPQAA